MKHPIGNFSFALIIIPLLCLTIIPFSANAQRRPMTIIPYDDTGYRYKVANSSRFRGFERSDFDDSEFDSGDAPFGTQHEDCPSYDDIKTRWPSGTSILVRKTFNLPRDAHDVKVAVAIDNDVRVYINGRFIGSDHHEGCARRDRFVYPVPDNFLNVGSNLIAVVGTDDGRGGSYLDIQVTAQVNEDRPDESVNDNRNKSRADGSEVLARPARGGTCNEWGPWSQVPQWKGLDYRLRCECGTGADYRGEHVYTWYVKFRNRYQEPISFAFFLADSEFAKPRGGGGRQTLKAQESEWGPGSFEFVRSNCGETVWVGVGKVRFGEDNGPYAKPNNR